MLCMLGKDGSWALPHLLMPMFHALQVTVLQTLADERCLHLMPPLALAVLPPTAYSPGDVAATAVMGRQQRQQHSQLKDHVQLHAILQELQQGDLLDRCHASNSLVKDLRTIAKRSCNTFCDFPRCVVSRS